MAEKNFYKIKSLGYLHPKGDTTKRKVSFSLCKCEHCGKEVIRATSNIKRVNSCGCIGNTIHGKSNTSLYRRWWAILCRAKLEKSLIHKDWKVFSNFEKWFLNELSIKQLNFNSRSKNFPYTIVRIVEKEGYTPTNVIILDIGKARSYLKSKQYFPDSSLIEKIKQDFNLEIKNKKDEVEVFKKCQFLAKLYKISITSVYKIITTNSFEYIKPIFYLKNRKIYKAVWYLKNRKRLLKKSKKRADLLKKKRQEREAQLIKERKIA